MAGLVGFINNGSTVENCYSTGNVSSSYGGYTGGLVAFPGGGSVVIASYWDTETSGQSTSAGGVGLPTGQMQMQSSFDPPWDFTNVWMIDEGNDYPRLRDPVLGCVIDCQCDDTNPCNGVETCDSGACVDGTPVDCGGLDDACAQGVCNPADGECEQDVATPSGSVCRGAASDCDAEEVCDGINPICPPDECASPGTSCDAGGGPDTGTCDGECACAAADIPTVSEWGLMAMTVLLLAGGTLVLARRRHLVRLIDAARHALKGVVSDNRLQPAALFE